MAPTAVHTANGGIHRSKGPVAERRLYVRIGPEGSEPYERTKSHGICEHVWRLGHPGKSVQLGRSFQKILSGLKKPVSLCFQVKDGPCCTFHFTQEGCRMTEGDGGAPAK